MASTTTTTVPNNLEKQNLAITTTPSHTLHLRQVPTPTPAANECLIHVRATGICGSDVHFWKQGGIGDSRVEGELGLGHESAGVVVRFGEGVEGWEVGEFAFFSFLFFRNTCTLFFFSILPVVVFKEEGRLATQFSIWKKDDGVSSLLSQVMDFFFLVVGLIPAYNPPFLGQIIHHAMRWPRCTNNIVHEKNEGTKVEPTLAN